MGRGSKFSFPLPGRKSHAKGERDNVETRSNGLTPTASRSSLRADEPSSYSKAERLLGTGSLPPRPSSRSQRGGVSLPQSPGYMTINVSDASVDSDYADKMSSMALDEEHYLRPKRPGVSNRASSNILGSAYQDEGRRGSRSSSFSRHLLPQASNSTMRSYYDPQKSPLSVSQQTSDSAVRDMALRKGKQPVAQYDGNRTLRPSSRQTADDIKKQSRKGKPAGLDLSKLFPKPRSNGTDQHFGALLSPNKLVSSPSAMSTTSEYFPRPMTRDPTPTPNSRSRTKLTKSPKWEQGTSSQVAQPSMSPVRLYERDVYDNAKVNVRRPPPGVQHWFDALGDESDEDHNEEQATIHAPHPTYPIRQHRAAATKSSMERLVSNTAASTRQTTRHLPGTPISKHELYERAKPFVVNNLNSPSQFSVHSQNSLFSNKTKGSTMSMTNLQNSSVLSISSSEDEDVDEKRETDRPQMSDSLGSIDDSGEIILGKAQAFNIRPQLPSRRPSDSKMSMRTTSTNAATIEVMYTPEPYNPQIFPRPYGSRRSSHIRQPSVILEDEGSRPKTSTQRPMSPSTVSIRSARTSSSDPRPRPEGHKLMAVTEEEEVLLEMMRRKRAAMAKDSFTEGYKKAISQEARQNTPPDNKSYRTSAFLSNESPTASPVAARAVPSRTSIAASSPSLQPPPRGRSTTSTQALTVATSVLRDSSSCDEASVRRVSPSARAILPHQLAPPPEFSPLDPFPSPPATLTDAGVSSPTTTDHPSPLPSPITPGLRNDEADVDVKVASSEPSCNGDNYEVTVLETGVIDPPSGSIKPTNDSRNCKTRQHTRRRTASSGANVPFSATEKSFATKPQPRAPTESYDLAPVSEASSRPPSIIQPKLPARSSKRVNTLTVNTNAPKSRNSSLYSVRTSSPAQTPLDRRTSKIISRGSSINSIKRNSAALGQASAHCSVNEDVLAAWGSLGGWRDIDSGRFGGA